MTHSASATVHEALLHASPKRAICTVSEPVGEGRAFAEELRTHGLDVELIDDVDGSKALAEADLFLIGADTVFHDGALCNKIGTTALAEAAQKQGVPTIVACEIVKLAPIEVASAPEPSEAERTLFEMTPPELLSEIVTEEGARHARRGRCAHRPHAVPARRLRAAPPRERGLTKCAQRL